MKAENDTESENDLIFYVGFFLSFLNVSPILGLLQPFPYII